MIDINNLRTLHEKATPGEWYTQDFPDGFRKSLVCGDMSTSVTLSNDNDATYIVALHNALPGLLEEIETLRDRGDCKTCNNSGISNANGDRCYCFVAGELRGQKTLRRYGRHLKGCAISRGPCSCGLEEALK